MAKINVLVKPDASISVDLWIYDDNGNILVWDNETTAKESEIGKQHFANFMRMEAKFREPNYRDVSSLSDRAFEANQDGTFSMNLNSVRMERVCLLLKSWNLKDAADKDIPANRENVEKLHPTIAFSLSSVLEQKLGLNVEG